MAGPETETEEGDGALARHVVEIVAPGLDLGRLGALLRAAFGARSVKMRAVVPLKGEAPAAIRLGKLARRILELLGDGRPWRTKHLVEAAAEGRKPSTVRRELDLLWEEGLISKPRFGVWTLAGAPAPAPDAIRPLRTERTGGPSERRVLERLAEPVSPITLVAELGVSRQRVDQILKRLLAEGKAVRRADPANARSWIWLRADADARAALRRHPPRLGASRARLLNALTHGGFHSIGPLAAFTGVSVAVLPNRYAEFASLGLVLTFRLGQRRYVALTPLGAEHPERSPETPHAPEADLSLAFGPKRIAFLETLAVLGEARTIEVTAALAGTERTGAELGSGQLIARMLKSDFAEPMDDGPGQRRYRLTEAGRFAAALVARYRPPPAREALLANIAAYTALRTEALKWSRVKGVALPAASPAQRAMLDALSVGGPMTTGELAASASAHMANPRSVHLALRTMERRGAVVRTERRGQVSLWALGPSAP